MTNIFAPIPALTATDEEFTELLARPGLKIERIISTFREITDDDSDTSISQP